MSSSSQSAARRSSSSSTSYTCGVPGSQVTLTINNNGERSLTMLRGPNTNSKTSSSVPVPVPVADRKFPDGWVGPAKTPFCKVCYDAGLPVADYTDHYVKDQPGPNGKVVCPTLLAQKCLNCGVAGHTSSYCPEEARLERERKEREREARLAIASDVKAWKVVGGAGSTSKLSAPPAAVPVAPPAAVPVVPACRGSFGILAVDDPSDDSEYEREQEEIRNTPANVPKPVVKERPVLTGPPPAVAPPKELTWAQRAAAAANKPSSTPSSSSSSTSSAPVQTSPLVDTRFQLHHALCHNIGVTQRGYSAKKATTANHRGDAAAVACEGSLKRKQYSVTIPA